MKQITNGAIRGGIMVERKGHLRICRVKLREVAGKMMQQSCNLLWRNGMNVSYSGNMKMEL